MPIAELATTLGVSVATLYHVASGRRRQRPLYAYALQGLQRELARRPPPGHRPAAKTPPRDRENITCSKCSRMMYRLEKTKDPDSGLRLWRMICKGSKVQPHSAVFLYVNDFGNPQPCPSKKRRRRLAPFERREGIAKCSECQQALQWQEEFHNRWGHKKLYCYRCTTRGCELVRRRVYRDASGRAVARGRDWRLKQRKIRFTDQCPICRGRLWRAGAHEGGRLIQLNCKESVRTKGKSHLRDGVRYPGSFYYRPGHKVLYVHGKTRLPNGQRELMNLDRWIRQEEEKLSPQDFFKRVSTREFTIREYADSVGLHEVTAGKKIQHLVQTKRITQSAARKGRRKAYRVVTEQESVST